MKFMSEKKADAWAARLLMAGLLALALGTNAKAATWPVCASGCSGQTIATALAAAITDSAAVIDLQVNTTEAVSLAQSIAEIKTTTNAIWLNTTGAPNLSITAAATGQMLIDGGLTFRHTGTAGDLIHWVAIGPASSLRLDSIAFDQQTDDNGLVMDVSATAANQLRINRLTAEGNSAGSVNERCIRLLGAGTVANSYSLTNSLLKNWGRAVISLTGSTSSNILLNIGNNTIYHSGTTTAQGAAAIRLSCGFSAVNNLILGGSSSQADVLFDNSATCGMEINSLHGATTPTPCGTPAIFTGVSPTNVFVNPGTDFRLLPGSKAADTGVTVTWIPTADLNGTPRPQGVAWDMGAIENIVTSTFTATPTFSNTSTPTPSFSNTTTPTSTFSSTATPSYSSTATPSSTFSPTPCPTPTPVPSSGIVTPYSCDIPTTLTGSRWWRFNQ